MLTRREFIKRLILGAVILSFNSEVHANKAFHNSEINPFNTIYRAINGRPDMNLAKVIDMMGGIETIIGDDDIVLIKPNAQWWNHGVPNLAALKAFIDLIMERPGGFKGEVVLAENCHRGPMPWDAHRSGWIHLFEWNSDIPQVSNMNDLVQILKKNCGNKFSVCHLIDVQMGNKRVYNPSDGMGYVYCDGSNGVPLLSIDNGACGTDYRSTIMTYPILRSEKGTIIDFKNGIWERYNRWG